MTFKFVEALMGVLLRIVSTCGCAVFRGFAGFYKGTSGVCCSAKNPYPLFIVKGFLMFLRGFLFAKF